MQISTIKKQNLINVDGTIFIDDNTDINILHIGKDKDQITKEIKFVITKPNIKSDIKIKAVVFDHAKIDLNALIKIEKGAINSNVYLKIDCLIVGDNAYARVIPSLEIKENEVKAGHGATIGCIDSTSLNYLQSKGLSKTDSEKLLIDSFLNNF